MDSNLDLLFVVCVLSFLPLLFSPAHNNPLLEEPRGFFGNFFRVLIDEIQGRVCTFQKPHDPLLNTFLDFYRIPFPLNKKPPRPDFSVT